MESAKGVFIPKTSLAGTTRPITFVHFSFAETAQVLVESSGRDVFPKFAS